MGEYLLIQIQRFLVFFFYHFQTTGTTTFLITCREKSISNEILWCPRVRETKEGVMKVSPDVLVGQIPIVLAFQVMDDCMLNAAPRHRSQNLLHVILVCQFVLFL